MSCYNRSEAQITFFFSMATILFLYFFHLFLSSQKLKHHLKLPSSHLFSFGSSLSSSSSLLLLFWFGLLALWTLMWELFIAMHMNYDPLWGVLQVYYLLRLSFWGTCLHWPLGCVVSFVVISCSLVYKHLLIKRRA